MICMKIIRKKDLLEIMSEVVDITNKNVNQDIIDARWVFERTPFAYLLDEIGKSNQTQEMLIRTLEFDKDPGGIMKFFSVKLLTPEICLMGIKQSCANLRYIPEKYKSEEICRIAIEGDIRQFAYIPDRYKTKELCLKAVQKDGELLEFVPKEYRTNEICLAAVNNSGAALQYVPKELKTYKIKKIAKEQAISKESQNRIYLKAPNCLISNSDEVLIDNKTKKVSLPNANENALAVSSCSLSRVNKYNYVTNEELFYIFDIHLEHQLDLVGKSVREIEALIRQKLDQTYLNYFFYIKTPLIIGGDVASVKSLENLFYKVVREYWRGPIIGVLGNHELWDCKGIDGSVQSIDQITEQYRTILDRNGCILLENDLLLCKDSNVWTFISESDLLKKSDEELSALIEESYYVILGGLGFSGYAHRYNAEIGMYGNAVTTISEDQAYSDRFRRVYDKVLRCSGNKQVVVVTHTPIHNWGENKPAPEVIYLNGHTHRNAIYKAGNGAIVYANNQMGYKACEWRSKSFCLQVSGYNPFKTLTSGIYKINKNDYLAANASLGISIDSFKKKGDILLVKNDGISMFFFRTKNTKGEEKLYILEGARTISTDKDLEYYYHNIPTYASIVKKAYRPYYEALCRISEEIKAIGGSGCIHGCIVDIDFFNHVYLNPIDGQVSFYYAEDMYSRVAMPLEQMLENTGHLDSYHRLQNKGNIVAINSMPNKQLIVPEIMFGTEMYEPSKALLKLQYLVEDDIIRVWKEDVLTFGRKQLTENSTGN